MQEAQDIVVWVGHEDICAAPNSSPASSAPYVKGGFGRSWEGLDLAGAEWVRGSLPAGRERDAHVLQPLLGFRLVLLRFYGVKIQIKHALEMAACASVCMASSGNDKPAQESELCWRSCTGWAQGTNGASIQIAPLPSQRSNNAIFHLMQGVSSALVTRWLWEKSKLWG